MNLTPTAVVLIGLIALLGIAGEWSTTLGGFPWWRLAAAALVAGLGYELLRARSARVTARWRDAERLWLGRTAHLVLELANGSRSRLHVLAALVFPDGMEGRDEPVRLQIEPGGAGEIAVEVHATMLGNAVWPPLPIRVRGPLGLAWWGRTLPIDQTTSVAPDTLGGLSPPKGSAAVGAAGQPAVGAGLELHHLRSYRAGDPRHTLDWKATARTGRMITRVYSEDQHLEIVVALDAGRTSRIELDGMSQLAHYANVAARFAEYCTAGDDLIGLVAFADAPLNVLAPARGLAAVIQLRAALAGLQSRHAESDPLQAAFRIRRLVRRRCLVVLLTDLYEEGSADRLANAVSLLAPAHLPIVVGLVGREVAGIAEADARTWPDPFRSLAAIEHARRVRANVARLARLGALALTAGPEEVDRKVLDRYRLLRAQHRI